MEETPYPGEDIKVLVGPFGDRVSLTLITPEKVMQKAMTQEETMAVYEEIAKIVENQWMK